MVDPRLRQKLLPNGLRVAYWCCDVLRLVSVLFTIWLAPFVLMNLSNHRTIWVSMSLTHIMGVHPPDTPINQRVRKRLCLVVVATAHDNWKTIIRF